MHDLIDITPSNKRLIQRSIDRLKHDSSTNLWAGIKAGVEVFEKASPRNNVQGMYILTDGMPNHMCPAQGYAVKLKPLLARLASIKSQVPTIHTFGFGYQIRSGLLQTIAEIGLGSYAFIPDAGMIGTVFVHAVANLYATYANQAVLVIKGVGASAECPTVFNSSVRNGDLHLRLGVLQFGQSRDVIARIPASANMINATLTFNDNSGKQHSIELQRLNIASDYLYHVYRSDLCEWMASLFPKLPNGEHQAFNHTGHRSEEREEAFSVGMTERLGRLAQIIACMERRTDQGVQSLLQDVLGSVEDGQITQAVGYDAWNKWGRHFLPSLLHAHARQVCNSFKDPGPLEYGKNSPLFIEWRGRLDTAFENLPAPTPSRAAVTKGKIVHNVSMSRYHDCSMGCFAGDCLIRLADDSLIPVSDLRPGMQVWTPAGAQTVEAIIKTMPIWNGKRQKLVRVGGLWITEWHPVSFDGEWFFPVNVAEKTKPCTIPVYSVMLPQSANPASHAVEVGGEICVALGHGITDGDTNDDARAHAFFGNHRAVRNSLRGLSKDDQGRYLTQGLKKDPISGLAYGYLPFSNVHNRLEKKVIRRSQPRVCKLRAARL